MQQHDPRDSQRQHPFRWFRRRGARRNVVPGAPDPNSNAASSANLPAVWSNPPGGSPSIVDANPSGAHGRSRRSSADGSYRQYSSYGGAWRASSATGRSGGSRGSPGSDAGADDLRRQFHWHQDTHHHHYYATPPTSPSHPTYPPTQPLTGGGMGGALVNERQLAPRQQEKSRTSACLILTLVGFGALLAVMLMCMGGALVGQLLTLPAVPLPHTPTPMIPTPSPTGLTPHLQLLISRITW